MTETTGTVVPLADRIREALDNDELQLPPLPELAIKLRSLLEDDDADASKIAELIKRDPAVAASLLRCANSALFGGLRRITDLNQAIARLGMTRVSNLVTAIQVKGNFEHPTPEKTRRLQELWDTSVACAGAARRLSDRLSVDAEEAFLAALLHDTGQLVVLRGVDHLETQDEAMTVTDTALDELMAALHAELGSALLASWNLPESMCEVAGKHELEPADGDSPLLKIVRAADAVVARLGLHDRPEPDTPLLDEPAIDEIGLQDLEVATLLVDIEDEFRQLRGMI